MSKTAVDEVPITELEPRSQQLVPPTKIDVIYGGPNARDLMLARPDRVPEDWDRLAAKHQFTETLVYKAYESHHAGKPMSETAYPGLARKRARRLVGLGQLDEADIDTWVDDRVRAAEALYASIKANGYLTQAKLGVDELPNEVRVGVTREGHYMFVDGRHRLAVARVLGLDAIPVEIVARHPEWMAFRQTIVEFTTHRKRRNRVYQRIDHPDLCDIPAAHESDRAPILLSSVKDYNVSGKRLLDIGAHWGHMTQQMDERGFDCVAVEAEDDSVRIARRIRDATRSSYDVWHGSVFDYPDVEQFNAILVLNIFHHFIKTEEKYNALLKLLGRFRADLVFFEPHKFNSKALSGAYRNYRPMEFAEFVAERANLTVIEPLGKAADGRELFKLTR